MAAEADLAMDERELMGYLRSMDYDEFTPLQGILAQAEAIGDPALPSHEQTAILNWLGAALQEWERVCSLEEPLAGELRRLKPLLAALAVTDERFLTPGAHPMHQLLDTIQLHAIGWQPRLGRLGQALEEEVSKVVEAALAWLASPTIDLAAINADMAAIARRAQLRASKMAQRLIDAEQGRSRVVASKREAALMINAALEAYPAPADVGEFIKGPWYESAQLVLLKFGEDSGEWESMSATTSKLLDSLQPPPAEQEHEGARRQHVFELIAQLETDLRHWLLSLQHDGHAVDKALELIEYHHSRVLRRQALELVKISPIALADTVHAQPVSNEAVSILEEGQWFILDNGKSLSLRAKLVMRMDDEQQLLFTNQAGLKVLQKSFAEFARLMAMGKVTPLDVGAGFSRCLARCAGLETEDELDEYTGFAAEKARIRELERQKAELERARLERERAELERAERERQQREQERLEQLRLEQDAVEQLRREYEEAARLRREKEEQEQLQLEREQEETRRLQQRWEEVSRRHVERRRAHKQAGQAGQAREQEGGPVGGDLNLPAGTWLGFRDGNVASLARLAVYDRAQNSYIFVDRHGTKVRQLRGQQLLLLVARGLTDILETRSRFREQVALAQRQSK
ncbi:MAG: DUF1631 family protein [Halieaceae bacterium]|nr:DUF1631 family protein [Halieaceae bacterium]